MKKLSPKMAELLAVMREGKERVLYMPYRGRFNPSSYYFCFGLKESTRCTKAAEGLLSRGLAMKVNGRIGGEHELALTPAGKDMQF